MNISLTPKNYYEIAREQSKRLLHDFFYAHTVSEAQQRKEITALKNTIHYEKFFL